MTGRLRTCKCVEDVQHRAEREALERFRRQLRRREEVACWQLRLKLAPTPSHNPRACQRWMNVFARAQVHA